MQAHETKGYFLSNNVLSINYMAIDYLLDLHIFLSFLHKCITIFSKNFLLRTALLPVPVISELDENIFSWFEYILLSKRQINLNISSFWPFQNTYSSPWPTPLNVFLVSSNSSRKRLLESIEDNKKNISKLNDL